MKMSVIIPTMWVPGPEFIMTLLNDLSQRSLVGEIIIIDNRPEARPDIPFSNKVQILSQEENIYVNPAWNRGVGISKYDKLLILNDDVNTDWTLLEKVYDYITPQTGMIGTDVHCWDATCSREFTVDTVKDRPVGYACLFFIHKQSYCTIPDELKVWCGDDFLFLNSKLNSKPNLAFKNWPVNRLNSMFSVTSDRAEFNLIKQHDLRNFKHLKAYRYCT